MKSPVTASLLFVALSAAAPTAFAQGLPPLPNGSSPDAAKAPPTSQPPLPTAQQLFEHVRKGLVLVEKNGLPVAIGTVLGTDGRILTALSGLAGASGADVLYADGTTVHAKVDASDKGDDLALLAPQSPKAASGLDASEADPLGTQVRAMLPGRGARLSPTLVDVKGAADAKARDGHPLLQMLDVDVKGPLFAGAPLLDSMGNVVAVLVKACKGDGADAPGGRGELAGSWGSPSQTAARAAACAPVVVAAPVSTIRTFLTSAPATTPPPAPWLGIRGEAEAGAVHGVKVLAVAPRGPAEQAGLKPPNDVIAAVDGQPVDSPEKLAEALGKHAVGETVKLLVFGQGRFREAPVTLRVAP